MPVTTAPTPRRRTPGQALIEYVLIVVLVSLAVVAVLTLTGPIIGNVFSNVVYNLLQQTTTPYATLDDPGFWHYVTVVAGYHPPVTGVVTYTSVAPTATGTNTPTVTGTLSATPTNSATPTSTWTPTAGPSPTIVDKAFPAPFLDAADNPNQQWHSPFYDAFADLGWTATYYTGASNAGVGGTAASTHVCPSAPASSIPCLGDVYYTGALAPGYAGVNEIIYTGNAPFEGRSYEAALTVGPGDSAIFKIIGAPPVVSCDNTGGPSTKTCTKSNYATPGTVSYPIEVDYYTSSPSSTGNEVKLVFSTLADFSGGSYCNWQALNPGHSPSLSWQDAAGGQYQINSNCNLRLRGSIDLNQPGVITHPSISFYDQWALGPSSPTAVAYLGVREYNFTAGANKPWIWIPVHIGGQKGSNWALETFDLTNFGNGSPYFNFMTQSNQKIEIAFKVVDPDSNPANTDFGWFVDDIRVIESVPTVYQIPINEDFDGQTGQVQWTPDCSWGITTTQNYPDGTPGHSFASNPGTVYNPNSDCSLYLGPLQGGVVDLTSYTGPNPVPQLVFQNKYAITGTSTALTVQYVSLTNHAQYPIPWQSLTPNGSSNPWVAQGTITTGNTWQQEVFNLNVLAPDKYYFRFRLLADNTTPTDQGWFIDAIQFRNRPVQTVGIPWADTLSVADNWTLSDRWGLTAAVSGGTGPDGLPHTMPYALTDSPGGAMYDTTGNLNNIAQLNPEINIGTSTLCPATFDPVLTFWSRWSVASGATLNVDYSLNSGTTWNPGGSPLWQFMYNQITDPFQTDLGNYNTNLGWRRFMVDLKPYACNIAKPTIMIRFHLLVPNGSSPADGWYVDDVAFYDGAPAEFGQAAFTNSIACQPNGSCSPNPINPYPQPFQDGAENSLQGGWYMGSNWQIVSSGSTPVGIVHSGTQAWAVVPPTASSYATPQDAIMELASAIDLTSFSSNGQKPVLSFWTRYGVDTSHEIKAEIMQMAGNPNLTTSAAGWIAAPQPPWIADTPSGGALNYAHGQNLGWTRQLMDLTPYTGKVIRLRFRLEGLTVKSPNPGMWLDDVYIGALSQMPGYVDHPLTFQDSFSNMNNWVAEGDWQQVGDWGPYYYTPPADHFTPVAYDYGNNNPNPQWDVNYYHYFTGDLSGPWAQGGGWTEPNSGQICSPDTTQQISNYSMVGGGTPQRSSGANMPHFTWGDGVPNPAISYASQQAVKVSGVGTGFSFTVTSNQHPRLLQVYVGAVGATAAIDVHLPGISPDYTNQFTDNHTSTTTNVEYDFTYSTPTAQLLTFTITNNAAINATDLVKLEAAEVSPQAGTNGGTASLTLKAGYPLQFGASTIDLTAGEGDGLPGKTDWAHWGRRTPNPGPPPKPDDFDHRDLNDKCAQAFLHQQAAQVNFTWDSTHIPANAGGNAQWATDAADYQYFAAVFKRQMTITPGEYRFWANANDGVRLLIDGALIPVSHPSNAPGNPALPYPWTSAGKDGWTTLSPSSPQSYFYDFTIPGPAGQHMIEVDYYQQAETTAQVKFQVAETTSLLHSNSLGTPPYALYSANQNTSSFINGYITVPAPTSKTTSLGFYERFVDGSNSIGGDPMYVAISIDGGFTWYDITADVIDSDPDSPNFGSAVSYGLNLNDQSNGIDPFTTYQNWHFHTINLSAATCNGATPCLSTSQPTQIALKFQLDARNSVAQGAGWFITNLTVIQN